MRLRLPVGIGIMALLLACAACGGGSSNSVSTTAPPARGIVSGVASPCEGPAMPQGLYRAVKVHVHLFKSTRVIAEQTETGSHTFRFVVPPGNYVVSSNQSATTPTAVTIKPGKTRTVNLYSRCF